MKLLFNFNICFFLAFSLTAQDFNEEKMDSLFEAIQENDRGMGGFAILKDGKNVYQKNIGFSNISKNTQATAETKYRIGSISKTFTAAMIMQLVEEGKLSLDTKLSNFFAEIPNSGEITIEDLLRHQTGLYNFTDDESYESYLEESKTREELLDIFKEGKPSFSPGEKNEYSNTNYVLLSFILEEIENDSYAEILKKRIVEPLNLNSTYFGGKINPANAEAISYVKEEAWQTGTETDTSIPLGAGGIVSTPAELNQFFSALFQGEIVKPATLEQMQTLKNGYGIGLFTYAFNNKIFYGHTGGIDGFNAISMYNPEEDLAVTYISNGYDYSVNDILIGAMSIYYDLGYAIPSFDPALEIPVEQLKEYAGTYGSQGFPLKISIFVKDEILMGQATGQAAFPLEAIGDHKFQFLSAGLQLEFHLEENKMTLIQAGNSYELEKE